MIRHAVYYAPEVDSAWWRFGARWLGRDEHRGALLVQPAQRGMSSTAFAEATAEPRRYGFHATLKAPFRLRADAGEALLLRRLGMLAASLRAVPLGDLKPVLLDGFVALVPAAKTPMVDALAARCVLELDDLRAPATPEELARRQHEQLDATARTLLLRYGYPHVLERFRFHMTLSGKVEPALGDRLITAAAPDVDRLNREAPLRLDRLCLFRQDGAGMPFLRIHDEELAP